MSPDIEPVVPVCLIKAMSLLLNDNRIALRRATALPRHWITAVNARAAERGAARFVVFAAGDDKFHAIPPPFAVALFDHLLSPPSTDVARIWPLIRELSPSAASFELEAEFILTATLCAAIEVTYLPRFTKDELVERLERIVTRCTELADALDWIDEYCAMPNAGIANLSSLAHLSAMIRARKVVSSHGGDISLPKYPELLRSNLVNFRFPIRFVNGATNECFLPSSTERTLELPLEAHPDVPYNREVIADYGHIDCIFGAEAARDVYPHIATHLDKTAKARPTPTPRRGCVQQRAHRELVPAAIAHLGYATQLLHNMEGMLHSEDDDQGDHQLFAKHRNSVGGSWQM